MRLYSFHVRADDPDGAEAVAVKDGFCWPAFLFDALWALYHRMWWPAAALLAIGVGAEAASTAGLIHPATVTALVIAMKIFVGLEGNDWRRKRLTRRGHETVALIAGADRSDAEQRFYERFAPAQAPDTPPSEPPGQPAPWGPPTP